MDKPVIGLQMDVDYLTRVREERVRALGLDRLLYKAEKEVVKEELDFAQRVYDKLGCQVIDVTGLSSRDLVNAIMSQIKKKDVYKRQPGELLTVNPLAVLPMVDTEKTLTGFMNIINFRLLLNLHLLIFRIYI